MLLRGQAQLRAHHARVSRVVFRLTRRRWIPRFSPPPLPLYTMNAKGGEGLIVVVERAILPSPIYAIVPILLLLDVVLIVHHTGVA